MASSRLPPRVRPTSPNAARARGIYCGFGSAGPVFAAPEQCALVLGPPRSGKTTSLVVPNVLAASGAVVCVSTKADVLDATAGARSGRGPVWLFDPSGEHEMPDGVRRAAWSPLHRAADWDRAVLAAEAMVGAASTATRGGEATHWGERAGALLSVLFHGAALGGLEMSEVCAAVDRREPEALQAVLAEGGSSVAIDVLTGILETDAREQSGIWSTASGVLRAYRTVAARASAVGEPLPVEELAAGRGTLFVVAGTDQQEHVAPVIAGLVRDLRSAVYEHHRREPYGPPLLLVLDELAHIAPLHDLPALVAEGASQGLLTLACLQDLSQARRRWGQAAEGFFSLFGTKIVLGGVGDRGTLETLSMLAGEREVAVRSSTRSASYFGRGRPLQRSRTTRREPRLSPADAAAPGPGTAWCVTGTTIGRVALRPVLSREAPGR